MNLSDLITAVRANVSRTDKDTVITTGLNLWYKRLCARHDFREMHQNRSLSVLTSATSMALGSNVKHVQHVYLIDGTQSYEVPLKTRQTLKELFPYPAGNSNARPVACWVDGTTLYFNSPVDDDYTVEVRTVDTPSDLALTTDEPVFECSDCLIAGSTAYTFRSVEKFQEAQYWDVEAERLAIEAIRYDKRRHSDLRSDPFDVSPVTKSPWLDPFAQTD